MNLVSNFLLPLYINFDSYQSTFFPCTIGIYILNAYDVYSLIELHSISFFLVSQTNFKR